MKKMVYVFLFLSILVLFAGVVDNVKIKAASYDVKGYKLTFSEDTDYKIGGGKSKFEHIIEGDTSWGSLKINGNIEKISEQSYNILDGVFSLSYEINPLKYNLGERAWHIDEDNDDDVDDLELENDIGKGAIIVRTSFDGAKWTIDKTLTDVFAYSSTLGNDFYSGKTIQLVNGCDYQITIVYKQAAKTGDSWLGSNWEYRWILERYEFYAENTEEKNKSTSSYDIPRREIGEKIKTKKNEGYSGNEPIDLDDPHYGWDIGTFVINGYTNAIETNVDNIVFTKKPGDKVTLWFCLGQAIDRLRGNSDLSIAEDKEGSDQYFQINKTNFRRGALIIRYTDYEGIKHNPIIYTNFLEANTKTGANTKVELFEEGDYEVALDYKILNTKGINSTTDYRIFFKFSIRNGNCMVYPFDALTKNELSDNAVTTNGFSIDFAKSRYLNIFIERSILKKDDYGYIKDVRSSWPAKDGEVYTEEGIYRITVNNQYSGESVEKTIYIGDLAIYKALSKSGMTLTEINNKLQEGCEIDLAGNIITPVPTTLTNSNEITEDDIKSEDRVDSDKDSTANALLGSKTSDNESLDKSGSSTWIYIVLIMLTIICLGGICGYRFVKTRRKDINAVSTSIKSEEKLVDTEEEPVDSHHDEE